MIKTVEYIQFENQLKRCIQEASSPEEQMVRDVLPHLSARLSEEFSSLRAAVASNHAVIERSNIYIANLSSKMDDVFSDKASINIKVDFDKSRTALGQISSPSPDLPGMLAQTANHSQHIKAPDVPASEPEACLTVVADKAITTPPEYRMSRAIASVHDLWREWSVGMAGLPSVQSLCGCMGS